jgi:glutaredoxin/glutathione-dependent peroxiredoxin
MTIKAGDKMPSGTFTIPGPDGPQKLTTDQLFAGKKVVLFSVPGAFTPTCDARHLPGNDVFVMKAWAKASAVEEKVLMLADGNAEYSKALGLELDATGFGMGIRGKRFALVVDNGVARHVLVEGPGEFKVSSAEHVLGQL